MACHFLTRAKGNEDSVLNFKRCTDYLNDVDGNVMFAQQVNGYGKPGGKLKELVDIAIVVPENETFNTIRNPQAMSVVR